MAGGMFQGMSPVSSHRQGGRSRFEGAGALVVRWPQQPVAAASPAAGPPMFAGAQQGEAPAAMPQHEFGQVTFDQKGRVARNASSRIMVDKRWFITTCVALVRLQKTDVDDSAILPRRAVFQASGSSERANRRRVGPPGGTEDPVGRGRAVSEVSRRPLREVRR